VGSNMSLSFSFNLVKLWLSVDMLNVVHFS
jgi:hypothetical protein